MNPAGGGRRCPTHVDGSGSGYLWYVSAARRWQVRPDAQLELPGCRCRREPYDSQSLVVGARGELRHSLAASPPSQLGVDPVSWIGSLRSHRPRRHPLRAEPPPSVRALGRRGAGVVRGQPGVANLRRSRVAVLPRSVRAAQAHPARRNLPRGPRIVPTTRSCSWAFPAACSEDRIGGNSFRLTGSSL